MFTDATNKEIDIVLQQAWKAFFDYRKLSLKERARFMRCIADELKECGDLLVKTAMVETNLTEPRLKTELTRTVFQLNNYSDFCESGQWMDVRIDTAIAERNPPKPDLRKMLVPLGPVVVFGASNFPFAYSTAGGDTACALAAGCPVIVKAHPAHAQTSELVAQVILKAAKICKMPEGTFTHVHGAASAVGEALVKHPFTKAVGFTGSFTGGKQLFDWGNQRKEPIPVFAEMSSVNPVFLLPEKMRYDATEVAKILAGSITLGVGQFCTNPGIIIAIDNEDLKLFKQILADEIKKVGPEKMLHEGIAKNYAEKKEKAISQDEVDIVYKPEVTAGSRVVQDDRAAGTERAPSTEISGSPFIASTTARTFISNPILQQEVFGPYSIIVQCSSVQEMAAVARHLEGQLTATLIATENDILQNEELVEIVKNICGRFIFNNVPTGVEVSLSMQHGGPFPSTTDSRFTSVGADGIKRFARPFLYQNWPDSLLPEELKNANALKIWRTVNNELSRGEIATD
jgi:2,5-dioxopentanoate dehydrogenase